MHAMCLMLRNGEHAKKFTIQDNPAMQRFASFPAGRAWRSLSVAAINSYQRNSVLRARVLLVASEAIPLAKTGGLADVITSLAAALRERNVDATILMPCYPGTLDVLTETSELTALDDLPGGPGRLWRGRIRRYDVPVLLLDTEGFRRRGGNPYVDTDGHEYADNAACFAALAHAAVRICAGRTPLAVPHVVHAHDWHAALVPALLRLAGVRDVASVVTVHNLAFQGNYPLELAPSLGIPDSMLGADGIEFWGRLSFLKAGIRYADRISTVSESYAREVLTPQFGCGLDGALLERKDMIVPIPNGIDTDVWNPARDPLLARPFSLHDLHGKAVCRQALLRMFELPAVPGAPLLAIGSRITHQKMADVALQALPALLEQHALLQVVVLGRGDHAYEQDLLALAQRFPGRVGVHIGYDERRAHALHAGADMLLHGTRFEPFGLTPIYSMRYGTIPIASRVGGMIDTIVDAGADGPMNKGATGVLFDGEQAADMAAAVNRALVLFGSTDWRTLQRNAMAGDFSWERPAQRYIALYRGIAAPSVADALRDAALAAPLETPRDTALA
jgi:starch synthase